MKEMESFSKLFVGYVLSLRFLKKDDCTAQRIHCEIYFRNM